MGRIGGRLGGDFGQTKILALVGGTSRAGGDAFLQWAVMLANNNSFLIFTCV